MSKATIDLEKQKFASDGSVKISGAFGGGGKTAYTLSQINALASATDINVWTDAYNDGQLLKQYVQEYDTDKEKVTYYTHPILITGKCLKITRLYTTVGATRVLQSETPSVSDWTFESNLAGSLSISLSSIVSPAANATANTIVTTLTLNDSGDVSDDYMLDLSGANASLYRFYNATQNIYSASLDNTNYNFGDVVKIVTASDFTNVTYTHSTTITFTDVDDGIQTTATFNTSGTEVSTNNNEFFLDGASTSAQQDDFQLSATYKSLTPTYGGSTFPEIGTNHFSFSIWLRITSNSTAVNTAILTMKSSTDGEGITLFLRNGSVPALRLHLCSSLNNRIICNTNIPTATKDDWNHYTFVMPAGAISNSNQPQVSINGGTLQDHSIVNNTGNFNAGSLASKTISETLFSARSYSSSNGTAGNRHTASTMDIDELAFYTKRLSQTECNAIYNSGDWHNLDDLTGYNLVRYFRMGDGQNDDVAAVEVRDIKNSGDKIEKKTAGSHGIGQLTMNDPIYKSSSGNHKYIQNPAEWTLTGGDTSGNAMPTGRIGAYQNTDPSKHLFGGAGQNNEYSASFWINSTATPSPSYAGHMFFNTVVIDNSNTTASVKLGVMQYTNNKLYTNIAGIAYDANTYGPTLTHNVWRHIVVVFSNSSQTGYYHEKIYIDGVGYGGTVSLLKNRVPYLYDMTGYTNYGFAVGSSYDNNATHSTYGNVSPNSTPIKMDEFSTYTKALSASEVLGIYNNGTPTDLTGHDGIEHWFRMGDSDSDTGTSIACHFHPSTTITSTQDYTQNH